MTSSHTWPTAMPFRAPPMALNEIIEAEFNATQLRDLARWMDVKLSGTSKIGFVEQIVEALQVRIARVAVDSGAALEGMSAEQQDFARRIFTARDAESVLPRSLLAAVWARQFDRDGDRKLGEMLSSLRRRALIFPTSPLQHGLRDVFYRWLPFGPNAPVHAFKIEAPRQIPPDPVGPRASFLDDFDGFLEIAMKSGVELRASLPAHPQAARMAWLRGWEHDSDDAQRVMNSRPGWVPDQQTGIGVVLASSLTARGAATLEDQTGLPQSRVMLNMAIACALQLLGGPSSDLSAAPQRVMMNARRAEEWLVLQPEQKLRRAWHALTDVVADPLEVRAAAADAGFVVQRAIGARELTPRHLAAEWCALRRYMARVLRGVPAGQWIAWDDLCARLFEFLPECAWAMSDAADWWFTQPDSRARLQPARRDDWMCTLGKVLEHIVGDAFADFGAVDVHKVEGRLRALRVTELGAWLFGESAGSAPESLIGLRSEVAPIVWNKEAMTLYVQPAPDRAEFIALMRRVADRTAMSFTYAITPMSIERALADGLSLDEVVRRFKRAGVSLPKSVSEQFRTASRRFGRVRMYQSLTVLELVDELAARELAANTSLMKHVLYRISPHAFVLLDEAVDDLIEEMQAKGYTPRTR